MSFFPDTASSIGVAQLNNIGAPAGSDLQVLNRPGAGDYNATNAQLAAYVRATPGGVRAAVLPAVLTATDHDKTVVLTGTSGTLSADGTIGAGFRAFLYNRATGAGTYSGISGLFGTTTIASGATGTVFHDGVSLIATASAAVTTTTATAYTSAIASASGTVGSAVQITYTPTAGVWPTGEIITVSQTGSAGSFSSTTLAAPANSSAPLTTTWTPTTATTATISSSTSPSMTNTTGTLSYAASASGANTYSMTESATVGLTNVAVTLSFAPAGGSWPGSTTLTPAATGAGVAGTFSPTTLSPTGTSTVTCTYAPSAAAAITFAVSNNQSLADPPNLSYTARVASTAYTQSLSGNGTGAVGTAVTLTVTPTAGGWPAATTVTPSVSPNTGTLSPSSATPQAGSASPLVFTYTPISAGSYSLNTSASPAMTNSTGALSYLVTASTANAYTMALGASSGTSGSPVSVTFTPNPTSSVWPNAQTLTPTASPNTGTFSFSSFSPTQGTTTPLAGTFTPSATGTYTISATSSPAMTNSTISLSYTSSGSAPPYPTVGTGTLQAIFDANAGVTTSSSLITALADQSNNGHDLTATAGVVVGPSVNGFPSIAFTGSSFAACSGLRTSAAWLSNIAGVSTFVLAFRTPAGTASGTILNMEPTNLNFSNDYIVEFAGNLKWWWRPNIQPLTLLPQASVAPNTVYKIILRYGSGGATNFDYWINAGSKVAGTYGGSTGVGSANFAIGQAAASGAASGYGLGTCNALFLEAHLYQGALSDGDVATYQTYLTNKWGS